MLGIVWDLCIFLCRLVKITIQKMKQSLDINKYGVHESKIWFFSPYDSMNRTNINMIIDFIISLHSIKTHDFDVNVCYATLLGYKCFFYWFVLNLASFFLLVRFECNTTKKRCMRQIVVYISLSCLANKLIHLCEVCVCVCAREFFLSPLGIKFYVN